jgi:hypothetical protein
VIDAIVPTLATFEFEVDSGGFSQIKPQQRERNCTLRGMHFKFAAFSDKTQFISRKSPRCKQSPLLVHLNFSYIRQLQIKQALNFKPSDDLPAFAPARLN